jgi:hypothetical protein
MHRFRGPTACFIFVRRISRYPEDFSEVGLVPSLLTPVGLFLFSLSCFLIILVRASGPCSNAFMSRSMMHWTHSLKISTIGVVRLMACVLGFVGALDTWSEVEDKGGVCYEVI